ncbi:glycosyltransferase family 2 protein [Salegentibacter sp. F188]|uniref:Glycosyltransferase family 2 protein n=1 Tax=Autumnicola patrickiae TaxID=3075591 RepID=A0ABU3E102_9FLAO|nr:glycosyltransferase family 2 protein [Salegentibacter sp. F188]MDT0689627.1 glycosyltransferase family 2 protein [Salegentibacter sp. F188]
MPASVLENLKGIRTDHSTLVSIIMPAYNSAEFITEAILSVQKQTYSNWELLVIDDASKDFTLSKVRTHAKEDPRIKLFENKKNKGTGYSRNKGIKAAKGDFIAFLDADDLWKVNKLEMQLEFMKSNELSVSYSSYERITENGQKRNEIIEALPYLTYEKLLKANYIGNLTGMYDVVQLGKIYAPEVRKRQDWALWLEAIKKGGTAKGLKEPLALYRLRRNSVSGNKLEMLGHNFNIYYRVLGFSFFKSLKYMGIFLKEQLVVKTRQLKPIK